MIDSDRRPGVGHPHVVLQLGHVLFGRRLFRKRPGQRELGLEDGVELVDETIEGRRHPTFHWMLDPALTVGDGAPCVALIPASVQRLRDDAELDNEVIAEVHRFDFAALFLPKPDQRSLVGAHNDPRVRPANEVAAVRLY